jgi:AICAR transformylase/IMP cyclohydrolase PurH
LPPTASQSARYLAGGAVDGLVGEEAATLKYGENAYQTPAHLLRLRPPAPPTDPLALDRFTLVAGAAPSYNNLAELDRHLQTITHIAAGFEPTSAPCPAHRPRHQARQPLRRDRGQ